MAGVFDVRAPAAADRVALAVLLEEMEAHYGIACAPGAAEAAAARLTAASPSPPCLVAAQAAELAGVALFDLLFPGPGLTDVVYLKDLYVRDTARKQGIGAALMRRVAAFAVARGAVRLEWSTGRENAAARAFYAALGAREHDKVVLQAEGAALVALARPRQR